MNPSGAFRVRTLQSPEFECPGRKNDANREKAVKTGGRLTQYDGDRVSSGKRSVPVTGFWGATMNAAASNRWVPPVIAAAVVLAVAAASRSPVDVAPPAARPLVDADVVSAVDDLLADRWQAADVPVAAAVDELTVLRRLSQTLHGTIPSLEEIRRFEADDRPDRLAHATAAMLREPRFGDYIAERLARAYVGTDVDPLLFFRRDRFTAWLSERLRGDRPYDGTVRKMLAGEGMWTDTPQVNFITSALNNDQLDEAELTARTVRCFLGQRIDCAQCHDHPFDDWTQDQFEGLAAYFAGTGPTLTGVRDDPSVAYVVQDRVTLDDRDVPASVPFREEWLPSEGRPRQQLAAWITHADQRRFDRATVNRFWTLMLGRPFLPDRPVDDLPGPEQNEYAADLAALDRLADDFRDHGRSVHRLIQTIAATATFRADTALPASDGPPGDSRNERAIAAAEHVWAVRPLVQLRPEQMIGAVLQAGSIKTIDRNSHLLVRALRAIRESDFIKAYGDKGEGELVDEPGTVSQALLRLNGKLHAELGNVTPLTAAGRILAVAPDDAAAVEAAFLVTLTRRPTPEESGYFADLLTATGRDKERAMQDLFWTLFNSEEFSVIR